jgi:hypothetical protein
MTVLRRVLVIACCWYLFVFVNGVLNAASVAQHIA